MRNKKMEGKKICTGKNRLRLLEKRIRNHAFGIRRLSPGALKRTVKEWEWLNELITEWTRARSNRV